MKRSRVILAGAAVIALFGSIALASNATEAAGDTLPTADVVAPLALERLVTDESEQALFEARQLVFRECMASAGFAYETAEYAPDPVVPRYGIEDEQLAATSGYDFYDVLLNDSSPGPEQDVSAGWEETFFGDPESRYVISADSGTVSRPGNGCIWESDVALYGADPAKHFSLTLAYQALLREASDRFLADPGNAEVVAEWSACMADNGYYVDDLFNTQALRTDTDPAGKAAAVIDARCKSDVDAVDRLMQIESAIQAAVLAENSGLVSEWLASTEQSVDNANAVISRLSANQ